MSTETEQGNEMETQREDQAENHAELETESRRLSIGPRFKAARESINMELKDAAQQLRLNQNILKMLEEDHMPPHLPLTFLRGYVRGYGKLLGIPEEEINLALEPIKPAPVHHEHISNAIHATTPLNSSHYFMRFFTFLIMLTIFGLVGRWWFTHTPDHTASVEMTASSSALPLPEVKTAELSTTAATADKPNTAKQLSAADSKKTQPDTPAAATIQQTANTVNTQAAPEKKPVRIATTRHPDEEFDEDEFEDDELV